MKVSFFGAKKNKLPQNPKTYITKDIVDLLPKLIYEASWAALNCKMFEFWSFQVAS